MGGSCYSRRITHTWPNGSLPLPDSPVYPAVAPHGDIAQSSWSVRHHVPRACIQSPPLSPSNPCRYFSSRPLPLLVRPAEIHTYSIILQYAFCLIPSFIPCQAEPCHAILLLIIVQISDLLHCSSLLLPPCFYFRYSLPKPT